MTKELNQQEFEQLISTARLHHLVHLFAYYITSPRFVDFMYVPNWVFAMFGDMERNAPVVGALNASEREELEQQHLDELTQAIRTATSDSLPGILVAACQRHYELSRQTVEKTVRHYSSLNKKDAESLVATFYSDNREEAASIVAAYYSEHPEKAKADCPDTDDAVDSLKEEQLSQLLQAIRDAAGNDLAEDDFVIEGEGDNPEEYASTNALAEAVSEVLIEALTLPVLAPALKVAFQHPYRLDPVLVADTLQQHSYLTRKQAARATIEGFLRAYCEATGYPQHERFGQWERVVITPEATADNLEFEAGVAVQEQPDAVLQLAAVTQPVVGVEEPIADEELAAAVEVHVPTEELVAAFNSIYTSDNAQSC